MVGVVSGFQLDGQDVTAVLVEPAVLNQLTHSAVASPTSSTIRHGFRD
jgi:hypothetical protein